MTPFCYHDGRNIVEPEFAADSDVFALYTDDALFFARQAAFERAAQQCEIVAHNAMDVGYEQVCADCAREIRRIAQYERNKEFFGDE